MEVTPFVITPSMIALICMIGFLWLASFSLLATTRNVVSFFFFRMFPFVLAIAQLVVALKLWGIV